MIAISNLKYWKTILLLFTIDLLIYNIASSQVKNDLKWPVQKTENLPGTYWWWMGSAVDEENLSYNLESLHKSGIGNVHIIPIYGVEGQEENYINFLSPEWMDMLSYTLDEADRLDMNVDMSTTTGWPFGGSHVTADDAAVKIKHKTYSLSAGEKFREEIEISNLQCIMAYSMNGEVIDISDRSEANNVINWTAPPGEWKIYALWLEGTGQKVKRAAPGNEGLVINPFSVSSLNTYLKRYDQAFKHNKASKLRAQYHDSYEYYKADWTENLFDEFLSRRGYDLKKHLPELFGQEKTEINSRIIADYRTTIADLHLEYIQAWTQWSNNHGWISRNEAHGSPANLLDVYAAADIPETETFGAAHFDIPGISFNDEEISTSAPPNPLILQFASSAAHVSGKNLVASETCTWLRDHFKTSLAQIKPEIDQLFLSGVNHIFYHGNAYSPKEAEWPGWMFYASTHFEEKNAFWRDISELNNYVARCQSILQSGKPANDILLYWPIEDIWHQSGENIIKSLNVHSTDWLSDSSFGKLAFWLKSKGYAFDYISDQQVREVTLNNGVLQSNGTTYKTIIIPKTQHIPIETWDKLLDLAKAGATIIIDQGLPEDVPGWFEFEERQKVLQSSMAALKFELIENGVLRSGQEKGKILVGLDMEELLKSAEVPSEPIVSHSINYIRRTHSEGFHYFLSNLSDQTLNSWVPMATYFQSAVILDPRSSNKYGVAATRQNQGQSEIYLQLKPGESCIIRTFTDRQVEGSPWIYLQKDRKPIEIEGEWKVEFIQGGPVLPATFTADHLDSWTKIDDQEAKRFAGTAKYSIRFNLADSMYQDNWLLDLGVVRESARIKLNGNELETIWSIPFSVVLEKYLKKGENILELEVTNLSANRLRDLDQRKVNWQKYFFVNVFYKNFDASLWPLMDSGLLGPVRLYPMKEMDPMKIKGEEPNSDI